MESKGATILAEAPAENITGVVYQIPQEMSKNTLEVPFRQVRDFPCSMHRS